MTTVGMYDLQFALVWLARFQSVRYYRLQVVPAFRRKELPMIGIRRRGAGRIESIDAVGLSGPCYRVRGRAPLPTAYLSKPLGLNKLPFFGAQVFFSLFPLRNVHRHAASPYWLARVIANSNNVRLGPFDRSILCPAPELN